MSKVTGTIVLTADYESKNGRMNVALTVRASDGKEYVAHIPKSTLENRGCFVSGSIEGEACEIDFLDKGEATISGTVVDKDHTLVRGVFIEALAESASAMGSQIRDALAIEKAKEIIARQKDESANRAKARAERLRKALNAGAPTTAATPTPAGSELALNGERKD